MGGGRRSEFSPPGGGRCRGATEGGRAQGGGGRIRRRCARTPPLPAASPPQGGGENWGRAASHRSSLGAGRSGFSPLSGGRGRAATEGGRAGAGGWYARRRCARTPPLPTASPPQGGEKMGSWRHLPKGGEKGRTVGISPKGKLGAAAFLRGGEDVGGERGLGAGEGGAEAVDCGGYGFAGVEYGAAGD